jgi:hypothetical protein
MPFMRLFFVFIAMLAVSFCGEGGLPGTLPTPVPTPEPLPANMRLLTVSGGGRSATVKVELAVTGPERSKGLMNRASMPEDHGMLFVFTRDVSVGFWMEQTLIPLDIAYLAHDGTVQEIKHGKPLDRTILSPAKPYRYTLEVNGGWFERQGLGVGSVVSIPPDLPVATD